MKNKFKFIVLLTLVFFTSIEGTCISYAKTKSVKVAYGPIFFDGYKYVPIDIEALSKLSWRFGLADTSNDLHIDKYISLNECELYGKYIENEFEWSPLRDSMRKFIKANKANFSNHLYVNLPIEVGEYNLVREVFSVSTEQLKSGFRDFYFQKQNIVGPNFKCEHAKETTDSFQKIFPSEMVFRFIRPLFLPYIKVKQDAAKEMVSDWRNVSNRILYIRIYFSVGSFLEFQDRGIIKELPIYMAKIDGYEVYRSSEMNQLITKKSYLRKKTASNKEQGALDNTDENSVSDDAP